MVVVLSIGTGSTSSSTRCPEERLEQVREIDGELAYEKMRRAVEKVSQEKARQAERARQVESRPERRGPERGGPERDFGLSR